MFDFGFGELLLIAVIALVVLGPERLPVAARLAGLWIRKARSQWNAVKAELENELADEELRRNLREASDAMRQGAQQMHGLRDEMISGATRMTRLAAPAGIQPDPAVQADPQVAAAAVDGTGPQAAPTPVASDPAQLNLLAPDPDLSADPRPKDRNTADG